MLISDPTDLMPYIPNAVAPAMGDRSYFDKLQPFIADAQAWVGRRVATEEQAGSDAGLRAPLRVAVATQTLFQALPLLDIVITPNGVATVGGGSDATLVPASQYRTEQARATLRRRRDHAIAEALSLFRQREDWRESPQGRWWGETLFPELGWPLGIDEAGEVSLAVYDERRPEVISLERRIADDFISPELMAHLRQSTLRGDLSTGARDLCGRIRGEVIHAVKDPDRRLRDHELARMVNLIREDRALLYYWEGSETARLFRMPAFRNDPKASAFFF